MELKIVHMLAFIVSRKSKSEINTYIFTFFILVAVIIGIGFGIGSMAVRCMLIYSCCDLDKYDSYNLTQNNQGYTMSYTLETTLLPLMTLKFSTIHGYRMKRKMI